MIVRVWRAHTKEPGATAYRRHLEQTVLPQLRSMPGFISVTLMQAERGGRVELVVASGWESMDAVRAFAGPTPEIAVVEPGAKKVLDEFDDHVTHYEMILEAGLR